MTAVQISVTKIHPNPNQPRKSFDQAKIQELAQSIEESSLVQPIVVEDNLDGTYTLVGGERRWRAHMLLGRECIEANVRAKSNHGGRELLIMGLIENVQRENMNPIDEAEAYQRLQNEYGMAQHEIGRKVGKHQAHVSSRLQLMKLEPEIRELIRADKLTHQGEFIAALLRIPDAKARIKVGQKVAEQRLNGKQGIDLANKMATMLGATRIEVGNAKSPAMRLAQRKARTAEFDEETEPNGWNALQQVGKVPVWSRVTSSVTDACKACALAAMANEATCGECPLVDFLTRLVNGA
jgi:ParB/RepB/Spo0J family partition protein